MESSVKSSGENVKRKRKPIQYSSSEEDNTQIQKHKRVCMDSTRALEPQLPVPPPVVGSSRTPTPTAGPAPRKDHGNVVTSALEPQLPVPPPVLGPSRTPTGTPMTGPVPGKDHSNDSTLEPNRRAKLRREHTLGDVGSGIIPCLEGVQSKGEKGKEAPSEHQSDELNTKGSHEVISQFTNKQGTGHHRGDSEAGSSTVS
ncbi:hypothetical protein MATL_G00137020 [Megalops atlanticus]|uniref:Uncharacterized protein n=1 Tax=Megalops atlanticus TaxID=7932 RepID=A0A9D3PSW0_MEGAT|nr:hypothetical protein MATL_G00137020 [Megalops atlanticus]